MDGDKAWANLCTVTSDKKKIKMKINIYQNKLPNPKLNYSGISPFKITIFI